MNGTGKRVCLPRSYLDPALVTVISIVETFDSCPSALTSLSVPMAILFISKSLTKARRSNSIVSTALLIARPLALTTTLFFASVKEGYAGNYIVHYRFSSNEGNVLGFGRLLFDCFLFFRFRLFSRQVSSTSSSTPTFVVD